MVGLDGDASRMTAGALNVSLLDITYIDGWVSSVRAKQDCCPLIISVSALNVAISNGSSG